MNFTVNKSLKVKNKQKPYEVPAVSNGWLFLVSAPQVHHADPPQMYISHPANELQPRQQHSDRRVWRRVDLALGSTALKRFRLEFFVFVCFLLLPLPNLRPCCTDVHCKKCLFGQLRWFLLLVWTRRLFSFPVCLPAGFVKKTRVRIFLVWFCFLD